MTQRIGIFGSYDIRSRGDLTILLGIISQIQRRFPGADVTVFAFAPAAIAEIVQSRFARVRVLPARAGLTAHATKASATAAATPQPRAPRLRTLLVTQPWVYDLLLLLRYARFWHRLREHARDLDLLLIGGGGLLVDLYVRWPLYPLLYSWLARSVGTPVMFYAVGVGPIRTARGRRYFRWAVQRSQGITVRDRYSYDQARQLLHVPPPRLVQAADPAFALEPVRPASPDARRRPRIGISTVAIYHPDIWPQPDPVRYQTYVQRMAALVAQIAHRHQAQVVLFSTNCPQDLITAEDIRRAAQPMLQRGTVDVFSPCSLDALFTELYPTLDLVLGTRLHSLILALIHDIPVVALAYQEKVAALGEELAMQDVTFPLTPLTDPHAPTPEATQEAILAAVDAVWTQRDAYRARVQAGVQRMRQMAERSVTMLADILAASGA